MSGGELSRRFYADVVAPLLAEAMPGLGYAAGRLGSGSDVLGFDDAMSRDHDWGCRLSLLVDEADRDAVPQITGLLERGLPDSYRGYLVRFPVTWDPALTHKVEVATVAGFAASRLGVDPAGELSVPDWLELTGQSMLEVIAGPVFADRTSELAQVRTALRWYPPDIERYVLAAGWRSEGSPAHYPIPPARSAGTAYRRVMEQMTAWMAREVRAGCCDASRQAASQAGS